MTNQNYNPGPPVVQFNPGQTQVAPAQLPHQYQSAAAQPMPQQPVTPSGDIWALPSDEEIRQTYERHESQDAQSVGFTKTRFYKFLGPQGQVKWDGVPQGYVATVPMWFMPGPANDPKGHYWELATYTTWIPAMNGGKGGRIRCGDTNWDQHPFALAINAALANPDPRIQDQAKKYKPRRRAFYNVAILKDLDSHRAEDGILRPFVLDAGAKLQDAIKLIYRELNSIYDLCHPDQGRGILVSKTKKGANQTDIVYSASFGPNKIAIPQEFKVLGKNINDLRGLTEPSSMEVTLAALQSLGIPAPGQGISVQVPSTYNPAPAPVVPSPYRAQPAFNGAQQAPVTMPPQQPMVESSQFPYDMVPQQPPVAHVPQVPPAQIPQHNGYALNTGTVAPQDFPAMDLTAPPPQQPAPPPAPTSGGPSAADMEQFNKYLMGNVGQ